MIKYYRRRKRIIKHRLTLINILVNLVTCIFIMAGVIRHWNR